MLELKQYTDKEGYTYNYYTIEDLCEQIVCGNSNCPYHPRCLEQKENHSCLDYMNKLVKLEKELKENERN